MLQYDFYMLFSCFRSQDKTRQYKKRRQNQLTKYTWCLCRGMAGGGNWKGRNAGWGRLGGGMDRGDTDEDDGMWC